MKQFLLFIILAISFDRVIAQTTVDLPEQNGIKYSYQLTKISETDKKDQYVVVFTAVNIGASDMYYTVPMMMQKDSSYQLNSFENRSFCDLVVKNSTGLKSLLDNRAKVAGQQTSLTTKKHEVLFKISKGQTMTGDLKFTVKSGQAPIFNHEFRSSLQRLEDFDIGMNGMFVNGTWEVSCGNTRMSLALTKSDRGQTQLLQQVNGKQQIWVMTSDNVFEKINDKSASLTYNKTGNIFTYTNVDGAICLWTKK